jgi:hypothetical protein
MQCTLLIPDLLWPRNEAEEIARGLALPALAKLLARASVERLPPLSMPAWLCQAFEVERQQDWPIAPLTLAIDGGVAGDAYWLRADPIHLKVTQDRLLLVDASHFDVVSEEAHALVATLNNHFVQAGLKFHAPNPRRWYVKLSRTPDLVTRTISEAAGADVRRHLPQGGEAVAWHGVFNEVQMVLHEHPVNDQREARGEPPINSVWLWGGGTHPPVRARHFEHVWSDDIVATALAAAAGSDTQTVPAGGEAWLSVSVSSQRQARSHLVVLDALAGTRAYEDAGTWRAELTRLDSVWFGPLRDALRDGRIEQLTLVSLGDAASIRFTVRRSDLLKLWRRPKALAEYA